MKLKIIEGRKQEVENKVNKFSEDHTVRFTIPKVDHLQMEGAFETYYTVFLLYEEKR